MENLPYAPTQEGYGYQHGVESVSAQLDGGAPFVRRDVIGAWGRMPLRWVLPGTDYDALCAFRKRNEGKHFSLDLMIDSSTKRTHEAIFVPGTFRLAGKNGRLFVVEAEVWVNPEPI